MCVCARKPENNKCKRVREFEHTDICERSESARERRIALHKRNHHHLRHENLNKAKAHIKSNFYWLKKKTESSR